MVLDSFGCTDTGEFQRLIFSRMNDRDGGEVRNSHFLLTSDKFGFLAHYSTINLLSSSVNTLGAIVN
jgi:hypothetical protein